MLVKNTSLSCSGPAHGHVHKRDAQVQTDLVVTVVSIASLKYSLKDSEKKGFQDRWDTTIRQSRQTVEKYQAYKQMKWRKVQV